VLASDCATMLIDIAAVEGRRLSGSVSACVFAGSVGVGQ